MFGSSAVVVINRRRVQFIDTGFDSYGKRVVNLTPALSEHVYTSSDHMDQVLDNTIIVFVCSSPRMNFAPITPYLKDNVLVCISDVKQAYTTYLLAKEKFKHLGIPHVLPCAHEISNRTSRKCDASSWSSASASSAARDANWSHYHHFYNNKLRGSFMVSRKRSCKTTDMIQQIIELLNTSPPNVVRWGEPFDPSALRKVLEGYYLTTPAAPNDMFQEIITALQSRTAHTAGGENRVLFVKSVDQKPNLAIRISLFPIEPDTPTSFQHADPQMSKADFMNQKRMFMDLSFHGICPKILLYDMVQFMLNHPNEDYQSDEVYTVQISEQYDMDLVTYFKTIPSDEVQQSIAKQLLNHVEQVFKLNLTCNDLKPHNAVIRLSDLTVKLIDSDECHAKSESLESMWFKMMAVYFVVLKINIFKGLVQQYVPTILPFLEDLRKDEQFVAYLSAIQHESFNGLVQDIYSSLLGTRGGTRKRRRMKRVSRRLKRRHLRR